MGLNQVSPRVRTTNADARWALMTLPAGERYDLVFGDAFNGFAVPYHLTTREFAQLVAEHLEPDGYYAVTVVDVFEDGLLLRAVVLTLRQVFPSVQIAASTEYWGFDLRAPFLVIAGARPLDSQTLRQAQPDPSAPLTAVFLSPDEMDAWLAREPAPILTDDYVPVDQLLLPVIDEAAPYQPKQ
jgi:spermidine synthase